MNTAVCGPIVRRRHVWQGAAMSASTPVQMPPEDKLDVLRYLDEFHYWYALTDERNCQRCGRIITGSQILVIELQGTRGKLRLQCPTAGCVSTPGDWTYTNPVRVAKLRAASSARAAATNAEAIARQRLYQGKRAAKRKIAATAKPAFMFARAPSFRAILARLVLLRPIATALHAFRPIN
jgi:hypothetical protein